MQKHALRIAERGIEEKELMAGLTMVCQAALPKVMSGFDQVWHW